MLQTLDSTSTTLAVGANGSATYSGGTALADGSTYYWRAKNVDSTANASSYSATRSFLVDTTAPTMSSAVVASDGLTVTITWSENLDQAQASLPGSAFSLAPNGGAAINGTSANVTYPAANKTQLTLASAVHHLDSLGLTYTKPGSGDMIRDLATATGNAAVTASIANASITNNTANVAPSTSVLVTPADGQYASTVTPTLTATFADPDTQDTGKITFQLCSDNTCSTVLQTLDSTSTTLAVGANGSATYSGGTALVDGNTYYWRAKNVDSSSSTSSYSATRSLIIDTSGPTNAFSLTGVSTAGGLPVAYYPGSGSTIFYNGSAGSGAKSFTLRAVATDGGSGSASVTTQSFANGGSNMSHTTATTTAPGSGTFDTNAFTFTPSTSGNPTVDALTTDAAGNQSSTTSFTLRNDTTAPTGGAISVGAFSSSLTVSPNVTALYAETASSTVSGLKAAGGNALVRTQASPSSPGVCPAAGAITGNSTTVNANVTATGTIGDTVPTDGLCYAYTLTGTDNVGNAVSVATIVLVDTTGPSAPATFGFASFTHAYWPGVGSVVYFQGGGAGGFTVTASGATDSESGVAGYTYPALGAGWTNTGGDFSFDASAATQTGGVTAQNNAGLSGSATSFTAQADASAPTSGITCNSAACGAGWYTTSPVAISIAAAGEAGASGVKQIVYTTDGTNPTTSGTAVTVSAATAAFNLTALGTTTIKWAAEDNVGNVSGVSSQVVKLDDTPPSAPTLAYSGFDHAYYPGSGSIVYFDDSGASGGFTVGASGSSDADSAIAGYTYPALGTGWTGLAGVYTFDATAGTQSGSVTAQNGAGLSSSGTTFTARADATAPASSMTCNTNPCGAGWINSAPVDIAINGDDGTGSGVERIVYTTDGTDPTTSGTATTVNAASATFQLSSAGTIKWFAVDNLGHASSVQSKTLQIDGTPPSAPTGVTFSSLTNGYWVSGTTVYVKGGSAGGFTVAASGATDGESGVAGYTYPALGSGWSNTNGDYTFTGSAGTQSGSITAQNNAGLDSSGLTFTAHADSSAPTSSVTCNTAACSAGWYTTSPVAISIAAAGESGESGVKQIVYTTDGTNPTTSGTATTVSATTAAFNVTTLGTTTIKWITEDNVGNVSTISTQTVELDTTAPTAPSIAFSGFSHSYYPGSGATVFVQGGASGGFTVTASGSTDADSGIAGYTYPALGSGWSNTGGAYTFGSSAGTQSGSITAQNNAGLSSAATGFTAHADSSAPTTAIACNAGTCSAGWYIASPVAVAITAAGESGESGVMRIVYTTDGSNPAIDGSDVVTTGTEVAGASASFNLSTEGTTTIKWLAEDNVGNITAVGTRTVKIDTIAPTTTIGAKPSDPSSNATPTFGFTSNEAGATFECSVDGGAYSACVTPLILPTLGQGAHTFDVRATDVAGNTDATPAHYAWTVDTVNPVAGMNNPGAHVSGTVTLTDTSSDVGGTGVASVTFEVSPAGLGTWTPIAALPWNTKTGPDAVADGLYDLHVVAIDNAGNSGTSGITNLRVDNTAPATAITNPLSNSGISGTVTLAASTPDADPSPAIVWQVAPNGTSTWTTVPATWNTKTGPDAVADGHYDVKATATDWAGNAGSATVTDVTVDNQAPTVNTTVPADASYVNAASADPFTVNATAVDNGTGVQQVVFSSCTTADCQGGTVTTIGTDPTGTAGTYGAAWALPANGSYWIRAVATDNVGHSSTSINAVTVDRTLPDTNLLTNPGDPTNDANPTFTYSASEATQGYECKLDSGAWTACTSPHSLASTPADGSHTFQIRAIDLAGNTDSSPASWTWNEDRTAPTATLTDPAAANAAHAIRGLIVLGSTTGDPQTNGYASGVDNATLTFEYSSNGTVWAPIATPAAWDTTAITDGVYQMHVLITDHAGNVTTSATVANVKIDNTQPVTAQDDPGANLHNTVALTGTAADPNDPQGVAGSGIDHVDFQISPTGAGTWTTVGTDTTSPYAYSYDTHSVADGHYDFRTVAYDVAGNVRNATSVDNRLIDNTAPVAQIVDPGANLHATVNLTTNPAGTSDPGGANASGIVTTTFEISGDGGSTWAPVSASWNTTGVADGVYDVRVTVRDAAANDSSPSVVTGRRVDNTKPVTVANGVPAGFSATDVTVTLSPSDAGSGVSDTLYQVDGGATQHGVSVLIPAPSNGSNDGSHTITFQSVDAAGNVEVQNSVTVRIDATPPACPTCSASDYVSGTVSLTATPSDSGAGIASVDFQYSANGTSGWTTIGTDNTGTAGVYSTSWNTTTPGDGAWHLRAQITDSATNVSLIDLHPGGAGVVVVDNTAPTAAVGAPTAGTFVSGSSVTISATSGDANPLTYAFLVNGSVIASGAASSTAWDTTGIADGPVQLKVRATDPAGNATTSAGVTVTVDNQSPSPTVNDPGAAVSGTPTISATTDADTATVEFQQRAQGAGTWVSIATVGPPYQTAFATGALSDGTYELRAIATDGAGHTGTSAVRTVVVDNTLPAGSIVQPNAGDTIGGPASQLHATASDPSGSGIQSVEFQYTPNGANTWNTIGTVTGVPYKTNWNATLVPTNDYDLRILVTDNAGNVRTTTPITVHVDSTAPTVTFNNPGANLAGTVPLTATTAGPDAVSVSFEQSPAGANTWQTISTDNASPWTASFDTRTVTDGLYDIRATAVDALGNVGTSVRAGIRIDNTAPSIVTATPADHAVVASASSIQLDASELVTLTGITLDGLATVAPTITGTHIDFATGALADGAHTLELTLNDLAGKTTLAQLHFTIYTPTPGAPVPPVEGNTSATASTTITSPDGSYTLTVPAGAWPAGANPNSWLVVRLAPTVPSSVPPAPAGSSPMEGVVEIIARWADGSGELHHFDVPLDIAFQNIRPSRVPATVDSGAWRMIRRVPNAGQLPSDWSDGYYRSGTVVHVLTRHLSIFGMAEDLTPPSAPSGLNGTVNNGILTLRWDPAQDSGKEVAGFVLFADDQPVKNLGATELEYQVGPFDPNDPHAYSIVQTDTSGQTSDRSAAIKVVPQLAGLTLDAARSALTAKGFGVGDITVVDSQEPAGTVVGPTGLVTAAAGSALPLQVSAGAGQPATKFVFAVVGTRRLVLSQRRFIGIHLAATRATLLNATLVNARGGRIYTWHVSAKAGVSIVKLTLPKSVRKAGRYTLLWTATSGGDVVRRSISVQILRSAKIAAAEAKKRKLKDVVLAGTGLPKQLPGEPKHGVRLVASTGDSTFSLTGDPKRNVEVIVVDVDQYSLSLVHNLRTVFPGVRLVVLTSDPKKLSRAIAAGATIALPKSTSAVKLVKVVAALTGGFRLPASRR